jgi:periplasmic protein CpxP/Spy
VIARRGLIAALLAGLASAGPASAQAQPQRQPPAMGDSVSDRRRTLEQMVRQRWMTVVQNRLQLTDAQMDRLKETNRHFSKQRGQLNQAEHGVRQEMRGQLTGTATADDKRLAVLIDSLLDLQRQRLEIVREEQHELSLFMTPLQRVRYLALQEQLRQRIEALRQRAGGAGFRGGPSQQNEGF